MEPNKFSMHLAKNLAYKPHVYVIRPKKITKPILKPARQQKSHKSATISNFITDTIYTFSQLAIAKTFLPKTSFNKQSGMFVLYG